MINQMLINRSNYLRTLSIFITLGVLLSTSLAHANPVLAPNYPDRYTVVEGDTLWGISGKFLQDPWRWPEVWQGNPQVENPDLIYPGDVLLMSFVGGKPVLRALRKETVRLSPSARASDFREAIPVVDPAAIQAYINSPLVTDENEMISAGYVVQGVDNRLLMGKYDQFYARGLDNPVKAEEYRLFRPGRHFVHPDTKESLGWEAEHVADARLLQTGDPARLTLLNTYSDVAIRDRLRPAGKKGALPFFYPKVPDDPEIRGQILETTNRTTEMGPLSIVAISLGEREGVGPGDVFRILSQSEQRKDPVTREQYFTPEEKIGLLLVFRSFEKVSYAIITNSTRSTNWGDVVVSPDWERE